MYQPIPKIESKSQCTGEAEYIGDISKFNGEVHCAFVIAEQGIGELGGVDPSEALVSIFNCEFFQLDSGILCIYLCNMCKLLGITPNLYFSR